MVLLDLPSRPRGAVCPPLDPPAYVTWSRFFVQNSRPPSPTPLLRVKRLLRPEEEERPNACKLTRPLR